MSSDHYTEGATMYKIESGQPSIEWKNEVVLMLIDMYRERAALWNPSDPHYKNKMRKDEMWNEIAMCLNCDLNEVKKKMDSLLTSFRRERRRIECQFRNGEADVYKSSWFAFDSMLFLLDKFGVKTDIKTEPPPEESERQEPPPFEMVIDSHEPDVNIEEQAPQPPVMRRRGDFRALLPYPRRGRNNLMRKMEPRIRPHFEHVVTNQIPQPPQVTPAQPPAPLPAPSQETMLGERSNMIQRDDCSIYGEFIAAKLKRYSIHTRNVVEHMISDILFNADMGEYEPSQYFQSGQYYHSPSQGGEIITND